MVKYLRPCLRGLSLIGTFLFSLTSLASVEASLDNQHISMGENIELTVSASDPAPNAVPDVSPLLKDFQLVGVTQTQEVTMVNHKMVNQAVWIFNLLPHHAGTLTIPALYIGNEHSQSLSLRVEANTTESSPTPHSLSIQHKNAPGPEVLLKADISTPNPYVQNQTLYRLRLYYDTQVANPQLNDPSSPLGSFIRLGDNQVYQTQLNHHPYQVIEMRYAFFPEHSGKMVLRGPTLTGNVSNGLMGIGFSPLKTIKIQANDIPIEVKSIPPDYKGWWLPSSGVVLNQSWSTDPRHIKVGEPITRTLQLRAKGVTAAQLPPLARKTAPGFDSYPNEPSLISKTDGNQLFAERKETLVYIPQHNGPLRLPPVAVKWFNTQTGQIEITRLPGLTLEVVGKKSLSNRPSLSPSESIAETGWGSKWHLSPLYSRRLALTIFLITVLSLLTLSGLIWLARPWFQHYRTHHRIRHHLYQACLCCQPDKIKAGLFAWVHLYPPQRSLYSLSDLLDYYSDSQVRLILQRLEIILYGQKNLPSLTWPELKICLSYIQSNSKYTQNL